MGAEFNKEMGTYLRQRGAFRRTNPFLAAKKYFRTLTTVKKKEPEKPLQIPQEQVDAVLKQAQKPAFKPTKLMKQAAPTPVATPARRPKMDLTRLFGRKKEEDYEVVETAPALDEDVKEVLKITFKWLKAMDSELIEEIKGSEDFEKYKKLLDKYGLIKK